jgi:diadenosine tetraphosphate (Ap4A) HIT family hydrolase
MCRRWSAEADLQIAEFSHSYLMLNRDQYFPGYCFLLSKEHVTELFHLTPEVRRELIEEVNRAAAALADLFKPDKINYELLGNMVPHMHWHLVPRFIEDALWPRPIWSEPHAELVLEAAEYQERIALIRTALGVK